MTAYSISVTDRHETPPVQMRKNDGRVHLDLRTMRSMPSNSKLNRDVSKTDSGFLRCAERPAVRPACPKHRNYLCNVEYGGSRRSMACRESTAPYRDSVSPRRLQNTFASQVVSLPKKGDALDPAYIGYPWCEKPFNPEVLFTALATGAGRPS